MTFTLTSGADTIAPWDRIGFTATSDTSARSHTLVDGDVDVTLGVDTPRTGTLTLLFTGPTAAADCDTARELLGQPRVWVATDTYAAVTFNLVREGTMRVTQSSTRATWSLELGYREVS